VIELPVSIFVGAIIVLIYLRYRNVFCLPFFWAAYFLFQYLGLLQLRARYGGNSYAYAAVAFGTFFLGLLAGDFLVRFSSGSTRSKDGGLPAGRNPQEPAPKPGRQPRATRIKLLFPVLPLKVGLFVSLLAATIVSFVFFSVEGFPILSSSPALAWVESTSGVVNRLMTVFGPGCYATLALIAWAVHRESKSRAAKGMMYLGLGLAILAEALLASKAAAIMIFFWFNMMLFYLNKKRELRKSLLPLLIVVVPISFAIVAVRLMSSQGYWQTGSVYQTFYERVTTISAQPVDFIFKYMNRFGPMHGEAMHREVERIEDQLTGQRKTATLPEFVFDVMSSQSTSISGMSATLTLYGLGYAEWGIGGLLLYSFLQGLIFGWIHRYLLRQETMNLVTLVLWGGILSYVTAASLLGSILIGLEGILLSTVPPFILLLPFCGFFMLPLARKYRTSAGKRVSRVPQE